MNSPFWHNWRAVTWTLFCVVFILVCSWFALHDTTVCGPSYGTPWIC